MDRTGGKTDSALGIFAAALDCFHRSFDIAQVIKCVEYTEHIDAVLCGLLNKGSDHIISVVAIAQQVLSAQQHLQSGVGKRLAQLL